MLVGVHSLAVKTFLGVYATMLGAFWLFFGIEEGTSALAIGVITVLGLLYFGLLGGGILVSDAAPKGERERPFADFVRGRVQIATGQISGREALMQILFLPVLLTVATCVFGAIWRITAW